MASDELAPRTRQQVLEDFERCGLKVSDWAKAHGFKREHVYAVLSGRARGRWGHAHAVAVALGLKRVPLAAGVVTQTQLLQEEAS